jgi:hypothetical protein
MNLQTSFAFFKAHQADSVCILWMKYTVHYAVPLMSSNAGSYSAHGAERTCRVWPGLIVLLLVYRLLLLSPLGLRPVRGWQAAPPAV